MNNNSTSLPPSLETLDYEDFLRKDIPVVVYLIVLSVIGTFGNVHAILIYSKRCCRSNHQIYIVVLGFVDLIACAVCIPFEIVDIRFSYTFTASASCKFFRFLTHFVSSGSGLILALIAAERYRKVCTPFGRQIMPHEMRIICGVALVVAFILSAPSFVFYGAAVKATGYPDYDGRDCTDMKLSGSTYYFGFLLFFITILFILCLVLYVFIGKALLFHMKTMKSVLCGVSDDSERSMGSTVQSNGSLMTRHNSASSATANKQQIKMSPIVRRDNVEGRGQTSGNKIGSDVTHVSSTAERKRKPKDKIDRTFQITLMLLIATLISYLAYTPNVILSIVRTVDKSRFQRLLDSVGEFVSVLMRGYFVNNAVNPIVYCFMDRRFRKECRHFYKKKRNQIKSIFT